jgi:hypothetical protein
MPNFITPRFRVSFPQVFTAKPNQRGELKYSIAMLFSKDTDLSAMRALAKEVARAAKEKYPVGFPKTLRSPFRDGDTKSYEGYAGHFFVAASNKMRPDIISHDRQPIINAEEFYPGCYARASLHCLYYNIKGNAGIAFSLRNLQKLGEGANLAGKAQAKKEFGDEAEYSEETPESSDTVVGTPSTGELITNEDLLDF